MAELQGYENIVLTYDATAQTFAAGSNSAIYVFEEGASLSQAESPTAAAGQVIHVYDVGSFVANTTWAQLGVGGPIRQVTGTSATTLTLGAGTGGTFAQNTRVLNVGSASDRSAPTISIYPVDQSTSTPIIQPFAADDNGNFAFFANTGDYDILIRNAGNTTDEFIIADVTLNAFIRSNSAGLVSLQNPTDDFSVGGTTLSSGTPAFYVDESQNTIWLGGNVAPYANLAGTGILTLATAVGQPSFTLINSTGFSTNLTTSHTANRTITFPDITGTVASLAGTQTFTGAKTFTGGVSITTAALSLTSALTSTSTAYFETGLNVGTNDTPSNGDLTVKRIRSIRGTSPTVTVAGLGSSGSVSLDANSTDQRCSFTVTANGTGKTATATISVTYGTTWSTAPFVMAWRNTPGTAPLPASGQYITWTSSTTVATITYVFTSIPSDNNTAGFTVMAWG